jgi:hypothetical protein
MTSYTDKTRNLCQQVDDHDMSISMLVTSVKKLVDDLRDDATANSATAATVLFHIKNTHASLDKTVKMLYAVKDLLDKTVVPAKMEADGVDMVRVPELARSFSKQTKYSASFIDKEKGFEWLRDIGQGDIIQETVNAGTLASFCRNLILEQGVDPPEDVVKVTTYDAIGINKYTPK